MFGEGTRRLIWLALLFVAFLGACGSKTKADAVRDESDPACADHLAALRLEPGHPDFVRVARSLTVARIEECEREIVAMLLESEGAARGYLAQSLASASPLPDEVVRAIEQALSRTSDRWFADSLARALASQPLDAQRSASDAIVACASRGVFTPHLETVCSRIGCELVPQMLALIDSPDRGVRLAGVLLSRACCAQWDGEASALKSASEDSDSEIRVAATVTLIAWGIESERHLQRVAGWVEDPPQSTEHAVALLREIGRLGKRGARLEPSLTALLKDLDDPELIGEVRHAISLIGS